MVDKILIPSNYSTSTQPNQQSVLVVGMSCMSQHVQKLWVIMEREINSNGISFYSIPLDILSWQRSNNQEPLKGKGREKRMRWRSRRRPRTLETSKWVFDCSKPLCRRLANSKIISSNSGLYRHAPSSSSSSSSSSASAIRFANILCTWEANLCGLPLLLWVCPKGWPGGGCKERTISV